MATDLIIRNARLRSGIVRDIAISAGRVKQISESLNASAERVIEAKGKLTTEAFVVPHLHLDKVMTGSLAEEGVLAAYHGTSSGSGPMNAIEVASKVKEHYNEHEIVDRVNRVLSEAERFGVSHVRAFADVDTKAELIGINALLKIKEEFKDRIALQIVAFPQDGIIRDPGTEELLYKAMDLGADVVG
jgi:cytosine deaminase